MSQSAQSHTPSGVAKKQRQSSSQHLPDQPPGRQLEPFFDESVAGDAIQPSSSAASKPKAKPRNTHKKPKRLTPPKSNQPQQCFGAGPNLPPERGYHSESGTAHFINGSRSRTNSIDQDAVAAANGAQHAPQPHSAHNLDQNGLMNGTPAKQVYAGPNFLASPAASSLPIPKAFAKGMRTTSTPSEPKTAPLNNERAQSTPLSQAERADFHFGREGSPLDFLFDADKAERLRQNSSSASPQPSSRPQPPSSRSASSRSLRPTPLQENRSRSHGASPSRRDLFMQEMDGIDEQSDSPDQDETPVTATYQQRMNAIRATKQQVSPSSNSAAAPSLPQDPQTEALKQMLFKSQPPKSPDPLPVQTQPSPQRNHKSISVDIGPNNKYPQYGHLSPMRVASSDMPSQHPRPLPLRQVSVEHKTDSNPALPNSASPADIKMMEDNLRKFLKIGS
ncbi:MAG: hypothetical protein Q9162_007308 [Coniocarpon cinnabarinum]